MARTKNEKLSERRIREIRKEMTEYNFEQTYDDYNLKAARINAGYSREDVAQIMKVTPATISLWEKSDKVPKFQVFIALCRLYRVCPEKIRNNGYENILSLCKKSGLSYEEFARAASEMN